jgi:hypothetical protein
MSLTPAQLHMLQILNDISPDALTGHEVIAAANADPLVPSPWQTPQAVHQTASALSRRGLLIKHNPSAIPTRGISYAISLAGKTTLTKQKESRRSGIKKREP